MYKYVIFSISSVGKQNDIHTILLKYVHVNMCDGALYKYTMVCINDSVVVVVVVF